MTEQQMQQLSLDVASKRGIAPYVLTPTLVTLDVLTNDQHHPKLWLHDDSARCFELIVEHQLSCHQVNDDKRGENRAFVEWEESSNLSYDCLQEYYADHNNDKPLATRIAILRALLAKGLT